MKLKSAAIYGYLEKTLSGKPPQRGFNPRSARAREQRFRLCLWSLLLPFLLFPVGCSQKPLESRWSGVGVRADGRGDDWAEIPLYHDEDMKFSCGVVNDDDCLHLMFIVRDPLTARMMERRGITVWFDPEGEKAKRFGLRCACSAPPLKTPPDRKPVGMGGAGPATVRNPAGKERSAVPAHSPPLRGQFSFVNEHEAPRFIPEKGLEGLHAAVARTFGVAVYELRVPIDGDGSSLFALPLSPGDDLNLGFEIAAVSPEEREAVKERLKQMAREKAKGRGKGGTGGGGKGGGMAGGGMGGGGMGRGGGPPKEGGAAMLKDLDARELWIEVKLAEKEVVP